jgi:hypothetical protein
MCQIHLGGKRDVSSRMSLGEVLAVLRNRRKADNQEQEERDTQSQPNGIQRSSPPVFDFDSGVHEFGQNPCARDEFENPTDSIVSLNLILRLVRFIIQGTRCFAHLSSIWLKYSSVITISGGILKPRASCLHFRLNQSGDLFPAITRLCRFTTTERPAPYFSRDFPSSSRPRFVPLFAFCSSRTSWSTGTT